MNSFRDHSNINLDNEMSKLKLVLLLMVSFYVWGQRSKKVS